MAIVTLAPPTSTFSAPSSCSASWTFEPSVLNHNANGLMIQNAVPSTADPACLPSGVTLFQRYSQTEFYSPGFCPVSYTTVSSSIEGVSTFITCCSSSYSYYTSATTFPFLGTGALVTNLDAGCIHTFPPGQTTVVESLDTNSQLTGFATLTGPISMWAQPLQYIFQQKDISLLLTSTSATSTSATAVITSSAVSSTATATNGSYLSTGAKAGIGVGAAVGVLALIFIIIFVFYFRKRKQRTKAQAAIAQAPPAYDTQGNDDKGNHIGAPVISPSPAEAMDTSTNNGNRTRELADTAIVDPSTHTSSLSNSRPETSTYSRPTYIPYRPNPT